MFNHKLTTFVAAADCGSFTKAAEVLFITPTAVMKQINALEAHLNLKLIERTKHGIRLTPAGEAIYKDAKFLFDYSRRSIENARRTMNHDDKTFRVGTSMLNPAKPFMDLWYRVNQEFTDYKLRLVPFEDNHEGILSEIMQLGTKFDFLVAVCDSRQWLDKCSMLQLGAYKKMVAVSQEHRLAKKSSIAIEDLYGEILMMVKEGDSPANDRIRDDLRKYHPAIQIEDTPSFYDISVFNRCIETGNVLLTLECWQDIHPALVTIPVDWNYEIPYGLLYAKEPTSDVVRFVEATKNMRNRTDKTALLSAESKISQ